RASDSTGYYASISSSGWGVDASLPGFMYQRIPTKNLSRLNIIARCDSLWGTGKCVIRISGENNWDFLYTDSIGVQEEEFIKRSIDIPGEWNSLYDSITIKLEASGYVDMWDEMDDGYATFLIHRVTANQRLLAPGRKWIYAYNVYDFLPDPLVEQTIETITVGNDTLINGLSYYQLIITKAQPCGVFDTLEYLREDGGKIYRLSRDHSQEFLMIDFDETTSYPLLYDGHFGDIDTAMAIIDSFGIETIIDGSQVEVQYLHIINNQSYDDDTEYKVYKGVGFVQYGLLFPDLGTGLCDVMEGIQLRCYTDGIDTLHFTEFGCYEITLGNATNDLAFNEIILSPNPVSDEIVLPDDFLVERCYSIHGQSVPFFQSGNKLDVHDWPPGMYLLKLSNRYTQEAGICRIIRQ
ncbi:MAG TPA: hypothetical protein VFV79_03955, partial [Saprospiraceae bacterium]|nr:hypothetical protein [Saprospiraceae bacterium]